MMTDTILMKDSFSKFICCLVSKHLHCSQFFQGPSSLKIGTFDKDNTHCQLQYTLCQQPSTYSEPCYFLPLRTQALRLCDTHPHPSDNQAHLQIPCTQCTTHPHIPNRRSQTAILCCCFFNDGCILMKDVRHENNEVVV